MSQIKEANTGIAIATARLDDEDMGHFYLQISVGIKRTGYNKRTKVILIYVQA